MKPVTTVQLCAVAIFGSKPGDKRLKIWESHSCMCPSSPLGPLCNLPATIYFYLFIFLRYFLFFLKNIYSFILAALGLSCSMRDLRCGIFLCVCGMFLVAACRLLLSCSMRTLSRGMHAGSSSLTRDRTQTPALGAWSPTHWTTWEVPTIYF